MSARGSSRLLLAGGTLCLALAVHAAPSAIDTARAAATAAGLEIKDLKVGRGAPVLDGDKAIVDYTGWLYDETRPEGKGKQFDSSTGRGPFDFTLGEHRVIRGWELGVAGMQKGGRRLLKIPADLAYGARGAGGGLIPPRATLLFEVRLLRIEAPVPATQ